jgi:hypothetical protein
MADSTISRRGRPPKYPPEFTKAMRNLYPETSPRTLANKVYGVKASSRFDKDTRFSWIFEADKSTGRYKREGLMQELGRFVEEHPASAEQAAEWLIESKPNVRGGIAMLRRWRRSLSGEEVNLEGDATQLTNELIDTINDYLRRYPRITPSNILQAIDDCKAIILQTEFN